MVVTAHDLAWIARSRQFTANYRLLHADFHIAAGRIFEDRRLRARLPRRYLGRGAALDPALPIRPPGSRLFLRLGKPVGKFPDRRAASVQYWYLPEAGGLTTPAMWPEPAITNSTSPPKNCDPRNTDRAGAIWSSRAARLNTGMVTSESVTVRPASAILPSDRLFSR